MVYTKTSPVAMGGPYMFKACPGSSCDIAPYLIENQHSMKLYPAHLGCRLTLFQRQSLTVPGVILLGLLTTDR